MTVNSEIIKDSIKHYGVDTQSTVCMEECAELIQAIKKYCTPYAEWGLNA